MKILIVCQFYYPETFSITDVAEGLVNAGHEVLVVTGKPNYGLNRILEGYENVSDEIIHGVRIHRCNLKPRKKNRRSIIENYLSFWWNSKRYLKHLKEDFDVVYSMSLSPLISIVGGTLYAKKHKVRHVLHCLDLWPESTVVTGAVKKDSLLYRVLFRWCRSIYSHLDEILVSSPSFKDYFHDVLGVHNVPISYVPQPPQVASPSSTVAYPHKVNYVYAGNIGTLQLVENLVKAVDLIKDKMDVCLHLIGMGARVDAVKALIEERSLQDHVKFYGIKHREETATYYGEATGIVVSLTAAGSVGKTIPSKLNSSLVYGRPILGVIKGDGETVLRQAGGAVLAKGETPEDIAEAMLELGNKGEKELEALGQANATYFHAHYETGKIVESILTHLGKKEN